MRQILLIEDLLADDDERIDQVGEADEGAFDPVVSRAAVFGVAPAADAIVRENALKRAAAVLNAKPRKLRPAWYAFARLPFVRIGLLHCASQNKFLLTGEYNKRKHPKRFASGAFCRLPGASRGGVAINKFTFYFRALPGFCFPGLGALAPAQQTGRPAGKRVQAAFYS